MDGFSEGFEFYLSHIADFAGVTIGVDYVNSVNSEIDAFLNSVSLFKGCNTSIDTLKGDLAEFWHAGTFNMNAAARGSSHRVQVDRSHDYGSADITGKNFKASYGLKYYKSGAESAKEQAISIFEKYKRYISKGGKESLEEYLQKRGFQDDTILHDPLYTGQLRVIPSDQMKKAIEWLEKKIAKEMNSRPEQVARYKETLQLLRSCVSDNEGNASIPLKEEDAKKLAKLAKEGDIDPKEFGLTTQELIRFEYLLKQSFKAGLTAATISAVLRITPELFNVIKFLIENGELDESEFKHIGFSALSGAAEGFVRGSISAAITTAFQAGLLGSALKSVDPSVVGAVTVIAMDALKNAYKVSTGEMTRYEMANELIRGMFVSTCALIGAGITQSIIEVPVLGFMIGSFAGSLAGTYAYSAVYQPVISFCIDTGFTMFGLVKQDYRLPKDVLREIGVKVFEYEKFEYKKFEPIRFQYRRFNYKRFEPIRMNVVFLRRGVIGVNEIGYL